MKCEDKDIIKSINPALVLSPYFNEWYLIVKDILKNPEFQKRKLFLHHHNITVWDHSIFVSFKAYVACKYLNADKRVCAIAGLLHDFYSQAWISTPELEKLEGGKYVQLMKEPKPWYKMHGFTHAKDAAKNYVKFFPQYEDEKITNCILRHMFPLNIIPPKYREGYIITIVDKINSIHELPKITDVSKKVIKKTYHVLSDINRI